MLRFAWLAALPLLAGCLVNRWSATPDGKLIALSAGDSVVIADGEWKKLAQWDSHDPPAIVEISPDGKWVVFNTDKTDGLWLVERETGKTTELAKVEGGVWIHNAWAPASNRLAYVVKEEKGGFEGGKLRIYNVLTGETVTALENCVPAYAWSPSGDRLFAVRAHLQPGVDEPRFGTLVSWHDGKADQLADVTGFTWIEALSESEVWFVTAKSALPNLPVDNDERFKTVAAWRVSTDDAQVSLVGEHIGWFDASPDRTHVLAWVLEPREEGDPRIRLDLLDRTGKLIRTLKTAAEYEKRPALVPMWLGNDRMLVPTGEGDSVKLEVIPRDGGDAKDVTADWKAWKK